MLQGSCCKLHDQVCSCLKKNHNDLINSLGSNLEKIDLKCLAKTSRGSIRRKPFGGRSLIFLKALRNVISRALVSVV